jgi:serine/threonine protein kinase
MMQPDPVPSAAPPSGDSIARSLEEYLAAAEAGTAPPREEFLARYPELVEELDTCLAALRFIGRAAEGPRSIADLAQTQPPEQALGTLGDFRIIREVGRGGMGVVYEAEQISLRRRVALKVLPFAATMDPRHLQRFHNEARAAASLDHPHIVPVHGVGCERGVHYYAMKFIDGQTLAAMIAGLRQRSGRPIALDAQPTTPHIPQPSAPASPAPDTTPQAAASTERTPLDRAYFRRVAKWGIQAAEALDHAHSVGIVHRDVKPANLLVDNRGGLWVTDFGLAHIQSDARLTMTGDLVGTLRYMSPEQALAKRVVVDHRTDVYSLGATLYELLTLEPAFSGTDRQELLRQIAFEEPRPPRRINRATPSELETIVLKAMEKNAPDRYATAKELAEDLGRFLADEPIEARPPGLLRRLRKFVRRRPTLTTALVLLLAFFVLALLYHPKPPTPAEMEQRAEQEYREATAPLERDLAQGRPVSLIEPTSRSLPCRWRIGEGQVQFPDDPRENGAVSVSALGPSLLELLPDTGRLAYRLVVELRHDAVRRVGQGVEVAVVFACSEHFTEEGPQFLFGRVVFADQGPKRAGFTDKRGRPAGRFQLGLFHLGASHTRRERTFGYGGQTGSVFYEPAPTTTQPEPTNNPLEPAKPRPGPWRRVEIEVSPGKLRAKHWEGEAVELLPAAEWPLALAGFRAMSPDLQGIEPPLTTRGRVGLYLEGSVVSLRRFAVEPLADGN